MSGIVRFLRNKYVLGLIIVGVLVASGIAIIVANSESDYETTTSFTPSNTYGYGSDDSDSSASDGNGSADDSDGGSSDRGCEIEDVPGSSSDKLTYESGGGDIFSIRLMYGRAYAAEYTIDGRDYEYDPKVRTEPIYFTRGGMTVEIYVQGDSGSYETVVKICGDYSKR